MAHRSDADLAKVVGRQLPQDFPIYPVFDKSRRVLAEAEAAQPFGNLQSARPQFVTLTLIRQLSRCPSEGESDQLFFGPLRVKSLNLIGAARMTALGAQRKPRVRPP